MNWLQFSGVRLVVGLLVATLSAQAAIAGES